MKTVGAGLGLGRNHRRHSLAELGVISGRRDLGFPNRIERRV